MENLLQKNQEAYLYRKMRINKTKNEIKNSFKYKLKDEKVSTINIKP